MPQNRGFDFENVRVDAAEFAQGTGQPEHIVSVGSARPCTAIDLCSHLFERLGAKVCQILRRRPVDDPTNPFGFEHDLDDNPPVAVFLAVIQVLEYLRFNQEGATITGLAARRHQGHNPARVLRGAAMVVRALPEAALPTDDAAGTGVDEGKILLPDQ